MPRHSKSASICNALTSSETIGKLDSWGKFAAGAAGLGASAFLIYESANKTKNLHRNSKKEQKLMQNQLNESQSSLVHKRDMEAEDLRHKREMNRQEEYSQNSMMLWQAEQQSHYHPNRYDEDANSLTRRGELQRWQGDNNESHVARSYNNGGSTLARRHPEQDLYYSNAVRHPTHSVEKYDEECDEKSDEDSDEEPYEDRYYRRNERDDQFWPEFAKGGFLGLSAVAGVAIIAYKHIKASESKTNRKRRSHRSRR